MNQERPHANILITECNRSTIYNNTTSHACGGSLTAGSNSYASFPFTPQSCMKSCTVSSDSRCSESCISLAPDLRNAHVCVHTFIEYVFGYANIIFCEQHLVSKLPLICSTRRDVLFARPSAKMCAVLLVMLKPSPNETRG